MIKINFSKKLVFLFFVFATLLFAKETISREAYDSLQKAQKMIENKQYTSARKLLDPIAQKSENMMERTYALQALANIYINQNKYAKVAKLYEKILSLNTLEKENSNKMKFSLSQIYLSEAKYKKSIKYSLELLNTKGIKQNTLVENLAIAYYYDQQYKRSIPYTKKLISFKKEKEAWYRMLYSSYIEIKNYKEAIKTLKFLVRVYPKEEYWMQLISIYQTTKKYKKSLATLELAYKNGFVSKGDNLMYLVSILVQNNVYNKAAKYIEEGINKNIIKQTRKNFDVLASCYLNAKNYKIILPKLEKSKFAQTSKYRIILANIYFNNGKYKDTIRVLKNFNFKKGSKYEGQKYILLGLSSYELNNKKNTKEYLRKASLNNHEKRRAKSIARDLGYKI